MVSADTHPQDRDARAFVSGGAEAHEETTMDIPEMHDYEQAGRDFAWQLPPTFNFGRDVIDRRAREADKEALIWCNEAGDEQRFNFSDTSRRRSQGANLLVGLGG